jgi:hypothetical protein
MATTSSAANPHRASHRPSHPVNLGRHAAQCRVCNHPSRAAIEFDFLNWRNPFDLVKSYHLRNLSTIYRHAHAVGLFSRRRLNLRFALERIVERVNEVPVTANAVLRSVRAITRINDAGEWVDPPSRVIISREDSTESQPSRRGKSQHHNSSRATRKSIPPPPPIFDPALLEESSPDGIEHAEQPPQLAKRAADKPSAPQTMEILISPDLAAARAARRLGLIAENNASLESLEKEIAAAQALHSLIANEMRSPEEPNA